MITDTTELSPVRLKDALQGTFLAVRAVSAEVAVDGPIARTSITVTFHNDLDRTLEGDLVFPLPPSAALCELTAVVGTRTLRAKIRPRARAQAEYTRAVDAGHTAALGETDGQDLARLRVAPIEKGEDVAVTLVLVHLLVPIDSGHRLLVPLTYMPRFVEGAPLDEIDRAALDRVRPLTLAARAEVKIRVRNVAGQAPVYRCASHPTRAGTAPGETVISVGPVPLDRDLHLEIQDRLQGTEPTLWIRHDPGGGADGLDPTTAVAIVPPAFADEGPAVARTVTFLVDRSGSMGTGPMASAIRAVRGSLRALTATDRFNVIAFDDVLEVLAPRPLPFDDASLKAADAFIAGIASRNGTNASMAIAAALHDTQEGARVVFQQEAPPLDAGHRLRLVVFMTDGDVAGAQQVLEAAGPRLVDTRLHVLGIGHAVNHAMLAALATAGGGTYLPVATDEDLEKALARLKNAIDAPLWTGIKAVLDHEGERRVPPRLEPAGPLESVRRAGAAPGVPRQAGARHAADPRRAAARRGRPARHRQARPRQRGRGAGAAGVGALAQPAAHLPLRPRRRGHAGGSGHEVRPHQPRRGAGRHPRRRAPRDGGGFDPGVAADADRRRRGARRAAGQPAIVAHPDGRLRPAARICRRGGACRGRVRPPAAAPGPRRASAARGASADGDGPDARSEEAAASPAVVEGQTVPPLPREPAPPPAAARLAPAAPEPLGDDEAGLRALLLRQGADGLFAGDLGATLAAVAALVTRGHTHREGLFRAELRRTVATLRQRVGALGGDDQVVAALALALLTLPGGEAAPGELPAALGALLVGLGVADLPAARGQVRAALAGAPSGWAGSGQGREIARVFVLV